MTDTAFKHTLLFDSHLDNVWLALYSDKLCQNVQRLTTRLSLAARIPIRNDGVGFSLYDIEIGNRIALRGLSDKDPFYVRRWAQRLWRYRKQLGGEEVLLTTLFDGIL